MTKVASIQTDIILNELLRGSEASEEMPANTIIVANNEMEIIEGAVNDPHTGLWIDIERDPDCLVCGDRVRLAIDEDHSALSLDDLMGSTGISLQDESEE